MRIISTLVSILAAVALLVCPSCGQTLEPDKTRQPLPAHSRLTDEACKVKRQKFFADWLLSIRKKHSNPVIDNEIEKLLVDSAVFRVRVLTNKERQNLLERSQRLLDQGCRDPLILSLHGGLLHRLERGKEAKPILTEAVSLLETGGYPAFMRYLTASTLHSVYKRFPPEEDIWPQLNEQVRSALLGAASDPIFSNGNQRLYYEIFHDYYWFKLKQPAEKDSLIEALNGIESVDPWLRHLINGEHHYALSWRARGKGWAQSIKKGGMDGFREEMALARTELVKAYALHPEFPEAAARMIQVRMASAGPVSEREWFDRAVAAQFDDLSAYDNLLWSMMPRWGGSHEAVYNFGLECLATERFDTRVPGKFVHAIHLISLDYDDPTVVYRRPGVYPLLQKVFENELNSPQLQSNRQADKTHYVLSAWLAGDYEQSAMLFNELNGELDPGIVEYYNIDTQQLQQDLAVINGKWGNTTKLGFLAKNRGEFAAALAHYSQMLDDPQLPAEQVRFAWQQICRLSFSHDENYSLKLAQQLDRMGLRESILVKYRDHLEVSGYPDKKGVFYNALARMVGRHNLDFVELIVHKDNLLKENIDELCKLIEIYPVEPTPQFNQSAISTDRELAMLRVKLNQDFSNSNKVEFKEQMAPRMEHLANQRMLLEFVIAHLGTGRLSQFESWNLAYNYFVTSAFYQGFNFSNREEVMARLKSSEDIPDLLKKIGIEGKVNGCPVLFLQMANLCRERGAWQEARNLQNLTLDWHQLHTYAMDSTPWVSYQTLVSLAMVEGYELEAVKYGELAVNSKFCTTANFLTASALMRLDRIDEAVQVLTKNLHTVLRQDGPYCLPDRSCADISVLMEVLLTRLFAHPGLSDKNRELLMDEFNIKLD